MADGLIKTLVYVAWMYGDTEALLRRFSTSFEKMPTIVGRSIKYGYWEENTPHYLLIASHDPLYRKPANVRGTDYNFLLTITSPNDALNKRVLSEFSGKVPLQALRESQSIELKKLMQGISLAYRVFEIHGRRAFTIT